MTTREERSRSLVFTETFLVELLDPKKTPRVPQKVRDQARACLRHFPGMSDFLHLAALDLKDKNPLSIGTLDSAPFLAELDRREVERKKMIESLQPFFKTAAIKKTVD